MMKRFKGNDEYEIWVVTVEGHFSLSIWYDHPEGGCTVAESDCLPYSRANVREACADMAAQLVREYHYADALGLLAEFVRRFG